MKLEIVFKSDKSANATMNFLHVEAVSSWSIMNSVLAVVMESGTVRYYPLCNLESFMEVA